MSMTSRTVDGFRPLPPEPWGRRMCRAREDVAGLTLKQAVELLGYLMPSSDSTISRLESFDVVPTGPRSRTMRQRAYLLCAVYDVDPTDLDLYPDDLPPGLVIPPRTRIKGALSSTKWYETLAA
jgi:hypothetical protein